MRFLKPVSSKTSSFEHFRVIHAYIFMWSKYGINMNLVHHQVNGHAVKSCILNQLTNMSSRFSIPEEIKVKNTRQIENIEHGSQYVKFGATSCKFMSEDNSTQLNLNTTNLISGFSQLLLLVKRGKNSFSVQYMTFALRLFALLYTSCNFSRSKSSLKRLSY